ncbi:MAG: hypothetical protein OXI52_00775 [Caldilineaceae bacterium]|nr:hypothetical protein [Caldilineaceae bacterium]
MIEDVVNAAYEPVVVLAVTTALATVVVGLAAVETLARAFAQPHLQALHHAAISLCHPGIETLCAPEVVSRGLPRRKRGRRFDMR